MFTIEELADMLASKKLGLIVSDKGIGVVVEDRDHYVVLGLTNIGYVSASTRDDKFSYVKSDEIKDLMNQEIIENKFEGEMETNKCARYLSIKNKLENKLGINKKYF